MIKHILPGTFAGSTIAPIVKYTPAVGVIPNIIYRLLADG